MTFLYVFWISLLLLSMAALYLRIRYFKKVMAKGEAFSGRVKRVYAYRYGRHGQPTGYRAVVEVEGLEDVDEISPKRFTPGESCELYRYQNRFRIITPGLFVYARVTLLVLGLVTAGLLGFFLRFPH